MNIDYPSIAKFQQLVELKDFKPPTRKEYVRYVRRQTARRRKRTNDASATPLSTRGKRPPARPLKAIGSLLQAR